MATTSKSTSSSNGKNPTIDEIAERTDRIKKELAALGEALAGAGAVQAGVAREAAETRVDEVLRSGERLVADMSRQLSSAEQQVTTTVRDKPLQSLGVAVAAGFLAAILLRR
ncbi:glycine zipper domain-containing protein [Hoeflea sp.]|uniref:glycine zipper domain-containing protein n=1 Tax=Hoeflea sp. TaxID=1940281 RepID=UPI003BB0F622